MYGNLNIFKTKIYLILSKPIYSEKVKNSDYSELKLQKN